MQRKLEYERQLESRDEIALHYARTVPRVRARQSGRFRREHQHVRRNDQERLPAVGRGRQGRDDRRPVGSLRRWRRTATVSSSSTTGAATKASPAPPSFRIVEFASLGTPDRARRAARAARVDQGDPHGDADRPRRTDRARRALLAHLDSDLGDRADASRRPARLREPAHRHAGSTSSARSSSTCCTATASTSCRASSRRASSGSCAGLVIPHAIAIGLVLAALRSPAVAVRRCFARWQQAKATAAPDEDARRATSAARC